jgi:SAM-dependent methyltransferase
MLSAANHQDGLYYAPTPAHHFKKLLGSLPISNPADFTFVDVGCGKGLLLLLAAEHGFGRAIGVELDRDLVEVARRNVRRFLASAPHHAGRIEIVEEDAAVYRFAEEPTVVFLFNPFGEETLRALVSQMQRGIERRLTPFFIAYYNPVHREIFDEFSSVQRLARTFRWDLYQVGASAYTGRPCPVCRSRDCQSESGSHGQSRAIRRSEHRANRAGEFCRFASATSPSELGDCCAGSREGPTRRSPVPS